MCFLTPAKPEMKPGRFPAPNIEEIQEDLNDFFFLAAFDLLPEYGQVLESKECREMTTSTCELGTFQFGVVPFA